jgi:antitoxin ParD1/3/4
MTTMNVSLPDDMKAFVEDRVAQDGYSSVSEYFRDLIRDAQRRNAKLELEAKLAEGLKGSPTRMTRKDWQAIKRQALDGLASENRSR